MNGVLASEGAPLRSHHLGLGQLSVRVPALGWEEAGGRTEVLLGAREMAERVGHFPPRVTPEHFRSWLPNQTAKMGASTTAARFWTHTCPTACPVQGQSVQPVPTLAAVPLPLCMPQPVLSGVQSVLVKRTIQRGTSRGG